MRSHAYACPDGIERSPRPPPATSLLSASLPDASIRNLHTALLLEGDMSNGMYSQVLPLRCRRLAHLSTEQLNSAPSEDSSSEAVAYLQALLPCCVRISGTCIAYAVSLLSACCIRSSIRHLFSSWGTCNVCSIIYTVLRCLSGFCCQC